uniref:USP domain-containing protein n=1 Tax=Pyxicephalus adspersus TaxID=30357 RepID=A0AAV3AYX0_PYXAD|nr:TPA: hypothetical protein GDO54_000400 [Pyxicephalus adspersus]
MEICNTVCPVPEKEHGSTELAMTYLSDNSISTKKLTEELVEPCEASTPPRKLQALFTNKDNSILDATGPSCHITSAMNECDNVDIAAPLPDSQLENSISTPTPCSQAGIVVDKKTSPLHETASAVKEISNEYTSATLPSDSEELKGTIKKLSFENTVLPDLLLDIQLEHRMEEQLSEAPSPASDTDLMDTDSADCKQSKEDNLLKTSLDKPCVQKNKIDSMEITDPERILQWKNRKSLCWLDCILSALVQSRTIAMMVAKQAPNKESIILHLFAKYDEAFELFTGSSKKKSGRPTKSEGCLHDVRMDIFKKLKPLLKCELGHNESPVFAFPLLLKLDPDFEKLFIHSFSWNFKCESCGYTYQDRCHKTITTFTKIVKDWHPLNAAHRSPCNKCSAVDQRREMRLETLQCMFMLHFVEGLPSSDLKTYAFPFGDHWYEIRTVIRYRDQHFSTWMANDDDTWLESDDLKGSFCRRHHKLRVRAEDLHVVIWERSNRKNIQDSSNLGSISENQTSIPTAEIKTCNNFSESLLGSPEAEPSEPASTKCLPQVELVSESIVSDPSTEHPPDHLVQTPVSVVPLSVIDKSSPLAGMEGYADDDVITLTLVEIPLDSEGYPVNSDPPNLGVIQVEESSDSVLQPALVEIHSDSKEPSQHTKPKKSMHSPSESPMSDTAAAPVCTIEQSPNQPGLQSKQTANMTATAIATSTPSYKSFGKKSVVDNLMCSLVKKDNSFLNSSLSKKTPQSKLWQSANLLKESDFNGATKKAENFDGFQAKSVSNNDKSSLLLSKFLNNSSSFKVPEEKTAPSVKSCLTQPALGHLKPGKNGLSFGKLLAKDGGSSEDKVQKLRMKLLKKLKAKKKELAIIEKISHSQQNGSHAGESNGVLPSGVNRRAHLQGFLQELQDHIDNVDNESIGTASSCTSICSSPGDAEFFAELFSPSPADNPGNDSRFLEMLADGFRISSDHSQQTAGLDHSMNNTTTQSTSGADAFPNASSHSSSGEESLNLLSSSTMAMLNDDADYLDSFVDIF